MSDHKCERCFHSPATDYSPGETCHAGKEMRLYEHDCDRYSPMKCQGFVRISGIECPRCGGSREYDGSVCGLCVETYGTIDGTVSVIADNVQFQYWLDTGIAPVAVDPQEELAGGRNLDRMAKDFKDSVLPLLDSMANFNNDLAEERSQRAKRLVELRNMFTEAPHLCIKCIHDGDRMDDTCLACLPKMVERHYCETFVARDTIEHAR